MCERTYVGCPSCYVNYEYIRVREYQTEVIKYHVDSDGDITHDHEPDYDGCSDTQNDGYECTGCGWAGGELDHELSEEDCECDECCEPDITEEGPDPDRIIAIVRNFDRKIDIEPNWPHELVRLATDRTIHFLPLPRWRATEINSDLQDPEFPEPGDELFHFDFEEISESVIEKLMYDYSDQPELKEANDGNVPACA
jgi:hypothetical protein